MDNFVDCWYHSEDGLRLYARDYACRDPDREDPASVLCMHGLTRNCADFAGLADHLCERYRVITVDQRGRGRSEYDSEVSNYTPFTYVSDMFTLLDRLGLEEVILVGTSMGGLAPVTTWEEAVAQCRAINEVAFRDFSDREWLEFTRGIYREEDGVPVLAYDPAIAQPMAEEDSGAVPPDLWPVFESIAGIPMLVVRGAESDILAMGCVQGMLERKPDLQVAEIPHRGHAPTLTEPASLVAIDAFLGELDN
jgi:pimeloyl-ACP methyl ester carboxylesterase